MKKLPPLLSLIAAGLSFALAGCSHLDLAPEGNPNRVLNGTVTFTGGLPTGAEVSVRVLDSSPRDFGPRTNSELPLGDRATPVAADRMVGEQVQTLAAPTIEPVPFRLEYLATDAMLRHGLNVEARISYGGRVRFRTIQAHVLTLASAPFRHDVVVDAVP
jgi:uncharacterized lipoprotein YbaY